MYCNERFINYPGNDIQSLANVNRARCKAACMRSASCEVATNSFVSDPEKSTCYLKSSSQSPDNDPAWTSDPVHEYQFTNFIGNDYREQKVANKMDCIIRCRDDPNCKVATYNFKTQNCWHKNAASQPSENRELTSWVKGWTKQANSVGNDIDSALKSSYGECETYCRQRPDCTVAAYQPSTKTCWRKNNLAPVTWANGIDLWVQPQNR